LAETEIEDEEGKKLMEDVENQDRKV